jgi:hypothetical protein
VVGSLPSDRRTTLIYGQPVEIDTARVPGTFGQGIPRPTRVMAENDRCQKSGEQLSRCSQHNARQRSVPAETACFRGPEKGTQVPRHGGRPKRDGMNLAVKEQRWRMAASLMPLWQAQLFLARVLVIALGRFGGHGLGLPPSSAAGCYVPRSALPAAACARLWIFPTRCPEPSMTPDLARCAIQDQRAGPEEHKRCPRGTLVPLGSPMSI